MFTRATARRLGYWTALIATLALVLPGCGTSVASLDIVGTDASRDLTPADSAPTWTAISVTPTAAMVRFGERQRFTAVATDSTGRTEDVTSRAEWSSSHHVVALVGSRGEIHGEGIGSSRIYARFEGLLSNSATLTVVPSMPVAFELSPASATLHAGSSEHAALVATGIYPDGTRLMLAPMLLTWASSDPAIASVSTEGLVTPAGLATGSVRITATLGGATPGVATVDVVPSATVASIAVTPTPFTACPNEAVQLHATATYTDGRTEEVTTRVVWTATPDSVVAIGAATGIARSLTPGTATIEASLGDVRGTGMFTVISSRLVRIEVAPAATNVLVGMTTRFAATAHFSCGETRPLTTGISWSSASEAIATVDGTGLAQGVSIGTTQIVAAFAGARGSGTVVVSAPAVRLITISPEDPSIPICGSTGLTATALMSDGSSVDVTSRATWSSAMESVVTVSPSGVITGVAAGGPVSVTGTVDGISGTTNVTVTGDPLNRIELAPDPAPSLPVGSTQAFTALGFHSAGTPRTLTDRPDLRWTTSDPSVATISNTAGSRGLVTAIAPGTTTIRAYLPREPCLGGGEVASQPVTLTLTASP